MNKSESIGKLAMALAVAQGEMGLAEKSAQNPHLKNNYADLTAVWTACRTVLAKNGLSVSQLPSSRIDENGITVIGLHCILMHGDSGEWISCHMESPAVGNRGVNDLQAAGSVITYLRRYTLSAIVGVATGDDDDGGSVQNRSERPAVHQRPPKRSVNGMGDTEYTIPETGTREQPDKRGDMSPEAQEARNPRNQKQPAPNNTPFAIGDDVMFVVNGDEVIGEVKGINGDKVTMVSGGRPFVKEQGELTKAGD